MPGRNLTIAALICVVLAACNHAGRNAGGGSGLPGQWYKRYSGTVGGKPVEVNLHHFDDKTQGSVCFTQTGEMRQLEDADDGLPGYGMALNEYENNNRAGKLADSVAPCRWALNSRSNTLNGKRMGQGADLAAIELTEEYPAGSCQLQLALHGDSMQEKKHFTITKGISYYQTLAPAQSMGKDEAAFLMETELHLLGGDTLGATDIAQYISREDTKFFRKYKSLLSDLTIDERPGHDDDWEYDFIHARNVFVMYNGKGMLSLALYDYDYSGAGSGSGIYIGNYTCVDLTGKKIWRLDDMVDRSGGRLSALLTDAVRKIFKVPAGEKLNNTLPVDTVPPTDNVYINGSGITFCYHPMTIGYEADGEIFVYLPYSALQEMLKPAFRARMGL